MLTGTVHAGKLEYRDSKSYCNIQRMLQAMHGNLDGRVAFIQDGLRNTGDLVSDDETKREVRALDGTIGCASISVFQGNDPNP